MTLSRVSRQGLGGSEPTATPTDSATDVVPKSISAGAATTAADAVARDVHRRAISIAKGIAARQCKKPRHLIVVIGMFYNGDRTHGISTQPARLAARTILAMARR